MAFAIAGAAIGLVEGGVKLYSALHNEKKDKAALANLKQPFYNVQNEFYQNKNIAAQQAQTGLTSTAKNYLTNENEKGLGAGVQAILSSGGSGADISKLLSTYTNSTFNAAAQDSEAQQKNIQYFMDINKELAGQKITQWSLNEYQPYENKLKQLTENIATDKANANNAFDTAMGSFSAAGTALSNKGLLKSQAGVNNSQAAMYQRLFSNMSEPYTSAPVDLNAITGGMAANRSTLQAGSPFNNTFVAPNTSGE